MFLLEKDTPERNTLTEIGFGREQHPLCRGLAYFPLHI